ncbi:MAG TPA: hypothetical protein VEA81_05370 [Burkholderiaceae bacterium]|nr:hypothetical protein [Burkholderiaceae bacterium]
MVPPWFAPLALASAGTIALRTMLMVPAGGRFTDWQRREAARMVDEKLAAVREAQLEAISVAWRMAFAPWTVWATIATDGPSVAMAAAAESMVEPFGRRASGNLRRLSARAMGAELAAMPLALAGLAAPQAASPAGRRARRR